MIAPPTPEQCGVFELRQYTLRPGRRDDLVRVFEQALVESQEAEGMCLLGTFCDLDRDDRFVWVRGFRDMDERRQALTAFYGGPVWAEHGGAASDTMVDFDDVLLLRPLAPVSWPPPGAAARPVHAVIADLGTGGDATRLAGDLAARAAADWHAAFATSPAENTFPALPIRADVDVVVVLAVGGTGPPAAEAGAGGHVLRLAPTARSRLR